MVYTICKVIKIYYCVIMKNVFIILSDDSVDNILSILVY